ncbi:hypothetical protein JZU68_04950, partial [bacterium]|nr:hypothetical protein [bacterium]
LQKFITESKRDFTPKSNEFLQELKEMDLLEYDTKSETFIPTGNAILLFGKNPRNKFPQAAIKAKVNYGDGEIGAETFDDALVLIPESVENWLKKVLPASIERSSFKAQQVSAFPIEVIREAVVNAITHRDYALDGAKVQLEIYPDRIIIKSPGEPAPPITFEALKNYTATSYSRNKKISFIFNEMGYMEESAVGMDTFRSLRTKYKLPLPIFEFDGLNIVVTFPRTIDAVKVISNNNAISQLTNPQLLGYEWLRVNGETSTREYSAHFNIGYKTAQRHLSLMKELSLIRDNGEDTNSPNYKYVIVTDKELGH